jgi:hypothetical protein
MLIIDGNFMQICGQAFICVQLEHTNERRFFVTDDTFSTSIRALFPNAEIHDRTSVMESTANCL